MLESEQALLERARSSEEVPQRVCSQLLAHEPRYSEWHSLHEARMRAVASTQRRERQVLRLRSIAVEQVHRTAVVDYLRLGRVTGTAREQTLRLFHGLSDPRDAALAEHRTYVLAAPTRFCTYDLLALVGDDAGLDLIRHYELAYAQYFSMYCERERARQARRPYLLESLLPEVKSVADRLRLQIVDARLTSAVLRRAEAAAPRSASPARTPARVAAPKDRDRVGPRSAGPLAILQAKIRRAR